MFRAFVFLASLLTAAAVAHAQPPAKPAPTPAPVAPATQPAPAPEPPRVTVSRGRGKEFNVQVEITISDQSGSSAPEKKVVTMLAADQTMGRIRANAHARQENMGMVGTELNVDARPVLLENDRILLELTLEYSPLRPSPVQQNPTNLNESLVVILQNGRPLTVSQAADPVSDRRMTVEVKATILR